MMNDVVPSVVIVFWWVTVKTGEAGFVAIPARERFATAPKFGFASFMDANDALLYSTRTSTLRAFAAIRAATISGSVIS